MPDISPNLKLNLSKDNDVFDHNTFLRQNFEKIDQKLGDLVVKGTTAPSTRSSFIGQMYIDTVSKAVYISVTNGNGAVDWKLISA